MIIFQFITAAISLISVLFSFAIYIQTRKHQKICQIYEQLFQLNKIIVEDPDIIISTKNKSKTAAYIVLVYNFLETIYLLGFQNEKHLQPTIKQFIQLFPEINEKSFTPTFVDFIKKFAQTHNINLKFT